MEKREKADGSEDNFFDCDWRFSRDIKKERKLYGKRNEKWNQSEIKLYILAEYGSCAQMLSQ